jgi:D-alanyl-D-alanine carboxypeptidase/D-alanyl-D-alanine-endopeptidase (penicillin-binding protein 4)
MLKENRKLMKFLKNLQNRRKKVSRPICLLLLVQGYAIMASGAPLQGRVDDLLAAERCNRAEIGVVIQDLATDSTIVAVNADKPFVPASVIKLVTAAAAFELLGAQYTSNTDVFLDGKFNRDSGVLDGNLYVYGRGDPGFDAERMWLFVQHLRHQGIRKITRDLVLDDSYFDTLVTGPGFVADHSSRAYEAPTAALSASFNSVAVHVAPAGSVGAPVQVQTFPAISGVTVQSSAKTTNPGSPSTVQVETRKINGKTAVVVSGGMDINEKPRYIYRRVFQTWENFGWVLQGLFAESGIEFAGAVRHGKLPASLRAAGPLYSFESRPLSEYVSHMFKYSSNFAAEMVFKSIAAQTDSLPATWEKGAAAVTSWWAAQGLPGKPVIVNGSGMGNVNRFTSQQITALLRHVWKKRTYTPEFVSALSIAGEDGTVERRFRNSPFKGVIRAKTGTLNDYGVSNLAGYAFLPDRTVAFSIMVNSPGRGQYASWQLQERILEAVLSRL